MKKTMTAVVFALAVLSMTACGEAGESFSRETVTVGGGKYDCLFEHQGFNNATMSCTPISYGEESPEGQKKTDGFQPGDSYHGWRQV